MPGMMTKPGNCCSRVVLETSEAGGVCRSPLGRWVSGGETAMLDS